MKFLLIIISLFMIVSCGGGGSSSPAPEPAQPANPSQGTVLNTSCDGTTLSETIANGSGGSSVQTTENATSCGYVAPTNTSPSVTNLFARLDEDTLFTGRINAADSDGDTITYTLTTTSNHGDFILNPDGSYTYQPNLNYVGADSVIVAISDGKVTDEYTLNIEVIPLTNSFSVRDGMAILDEDTTYKGALDLSNPDNLDLTFSIITNPKNGDVKVFDNGTYEYTPSEHYHGQDSILFGIQTPNETYTVNMGLIINYLDDGPQIFNWAARQVWTGPELEGEISYCQIGTMRWDNIISSFDLNLDGKSDILLPISCYQNRKTREEIEAGVQHNDQVIAAWKMFCSNETEQYSDCTKSVFETDVINATGNNSGGGNPYTHVWDAPKDLNGDGYPDIFYALNRDDGRPGFNPNQPGDASLLAEFCGERFTVNRIDCTREAIQSILLSNGDGTYSVKQLPWEPTNTQAVMVLKNADDGYDIIGFNYYGLGTAARIIDTNIIDVTQEYLSYKNFLYLSTTSPYNFSFTHEDKAYVVTPEIPFSLINNPNAEEFDLSDGGRSEWTHVEHSQRMGFSLWRFEPQVGFNLVDTYQPEPEDTFYYKLGTPNDYVTEFGTYIREKAVFSPLWHFFEYVKLDDTEEPLLVVQSEPKGMRVGEYLKAPVDSELYYQQDGIELEINFGTTVSTMQAFYIRDEQLVEREQSIIDEDIIMNMPGFQFDDLDLDGDMDMYGLPGANVKGAIYRNDDGTLYRLNIEDAIPNITWTDNYNGNYGYAMRRLGNDSKLSLIYWSTGFAYPDAFSWANQTTPSDFGIVPGIAGIEVLEALSGEYINQRAADCLVNNAWFTGTNKCNFYF